MDRQDGKQRRQKAPRREVYRDRIDNAMRREAKRDRLRRRERDEQQHLYKGDA